MGYINSYSYSTGGQGFMTVGKQTSSSGYTLGLGLFTAGTVL